MSYCTLFHQHYKSGSMHVTSENYFINCNMTIVSNTRMHTVKLLLTLEILLVLFLWVSLGTHNTS
jgi:hypothetical protein